jgi:KUP system potassium uptake protein
MRLRPFLTSRLKILGALSLIVWTLIIITSVKYITLAMRVDNDGEGGILALMALLRMRQVQQALVVFIGLFGAALVYGDSAITPAISVLSALEGLNIVTPDMQSYVLPAAVGILISLLAVQRQGTARIGRVIGPVMLLWFVVMALLGVWGIVQHPAVLWAESGSWLALSVWRRSHRVARARRRVPLCHRGGGAVCRHGSFRPAIDPVGLVVPSLPALLLNYAGQAAIVLAGAPTEGSIFFRLCPAPLLLPLVLLATAATVIASQAVITGAFSMTRQAIQLGLLPRLQVVQTSAAGYGQIYLPTVNWLLMVTTLSLAISFGHSSGLAAAYGIAVSATMLATTILLSVAMREIWGWPLPAVIGIGAGFATIDGGFLSANLTKLVQGGWVPLLLGALIFSVMLVWRKGTAAVQELADEMRLPVDDLVAQIAKGDVRRVPGTGVFVARLTRDIPPLVFWYLRHIRSLHESTVIVNVVTALVPYVAAQDRMEEREIAPRVWRAQARFGFMEQPDLSELLQRARAKGYPVDPSDATYFIGHETIVPREDGKGLPRLVRSTFWFLLRNSSDASDYFRLPRNMVVEIGRQFAI